MKNADIPAMSNDIDAQTFCDLYSSNIKELEKYRAGLTKREMMAMHMMAARVSIPGAPDDEFDAKRAVAATDALLAYLERTCQKS